MQTVNKSDHIHTNKYIKIEHEYVPHHTGAHAVFASISRYTIENIISIMKYDTNIVKFSRIRLTG